MIAKFDNLHIIMLSLFKYIFSTIYPHTIPNTNHINCTIYTYTPTYHLHWLIVDLFAPHHSSISSDLPSYIIDLLHPHTTSHSSHVSVLCLGLTSHSQYYTSVKSTPHISYTQPIHHLHRLRHLPSYIA